MNTYNVSLKQHLIGRKIDAIKGWRSSFYHLDEHDDLVYTCGLFEAKEAIEGMNNSGYITRELTDTQVTALCMSGFRVENAGIGQASLPKRVTVYRENDGKKINAIKDLRNAVGWGLKETKDVIDEMWTYDRPINIGFINEKAYRTLLAKGFTVTGWEHECFKENADLFVI